MDFAFWFWGLLGRLLQGAQLSHHRVPAVHSGSQLPLVCPQPWAYFSSVPLLSSLTQTAFSCNPMGAYAASPQGQMSSKFCQHSTTVTCLSSREPQLCPLQQSLELSLGKGGILLSGHCLSPRATGGSLCLLFLSSFEFSLLLISYSIVIPIPCYS